MHPFTNLINDLKYKACYVSRFSLDHFVAELLKTTMSSWSADSCPTGSGRWRTLETGLLTSDKDAVTQWSVPIQEKDSVKCNMKHRTSSLCRTWKCSSSLRTGTERFRDSYPLELRVLVRSLQGLLKVCTCISLPKNWIQCFVHFTAGANTGAMQHCASTKCNLFVQCCRKDCSKANFFNWILLNVSLLLCKCAHSAFLSKFESDSRLQVSSWSCRLEPPLPKNTV